MRRGGGRPKTTIRPDTARRVMRTFTPYRPQIVWIVLAVLASAALGILSPFFLKEIVNRGLLGRDLASSRTTRFTRCWRRSGARSSRSAMGTCRWWSGSGSCATCAPRLYDHLQGMSLRFFTGTRTGEIQSRLANDVGGVQGVLSDTLASVLSNVTVVLSTLVAMFTMDWRLTLLSVGILPLFAALAARVGAYSGRVRRVAQEQLADMNATMQETLSVSGALLTKTSGRQALSGARFRRENDALTESQVKTAMIGRYFFNVIGLTFSVTPVLVYWLAGYLLIAQDDRHLTLGTIVAFTHSSRACSSRSPACSTSRSR
jgi:ATP-binding cassette subfamily B protein